MDNIAGNNIFFGFSDHIPEDFGFPGSFQFAVVGFNDCIDGGCGMFHFAKQGLDPAGCLLIRLVRILILAGKGDDNHHQSMLDIVKNQQFVGYNKVGQRFVLRQHIWYFFKK